MFQKAVIVSLISFSSIASGQVGINSTGSNPHSSAGLDVNFSDLGLLIPRVSLTSTTSASPITLPATSLLVYNTATVNDVTPGFYYWNGSSWVSFATIANGTSDAWTITGNTGTTAGTNFLGTTDNQALDIRTNNAIRMRITADGNVGIGTTSPDAKLQVSEEGNVTIRLRPVDGANDRESLLDFWSTFDNFSDVGARRTARIQAGFDGGTWGTEYMAFGVAEAGDTANPPTERMRITATGNVGIGTTSPSAQLHTTGTVRFANYASSSGALLKTDGSGNLGITNFTGNTSDVLLGDGNFGSITAAGGVTSSCVTANYVPKMMSSTTMSCSQIFDDGINVGIGTTGPSYKLDVNGTIRAIDFGSAGSQNIIVGDDAYLTDIDVVNFLGIYGTSNSDRAGIRLGSDGSYIFGDNGNVGIGTTSPAIN